MPSGTTQASKAFGRSWDVEDESLQTWLYRLGLSLGIVGTLVLASPARAHILTLDQGWLYCPGLRDVSEPQAAGGCREMTIPSSLTTDDSSAAKIQPSALASYVYSLRWPKGEGTQALRISMAFGAYRLWLNRAGQAPYLLAENGHYAENAQHNIVRIRDFLVPIPMTIPEGDVVTLHVQLASFRGAPVLREPPLLGSSETVQSHWMAIQTERAALMGGFFMILLYCLALFWQRPADYANLWAGLLALSLLLRFVATEWILGQFFDGRVWSEVQNFMLMNVTTHLAIVCLAGFVYALYPNRWTRLNFIVTALVYVAVSSWSSYLGAASFLKYAELVAYGLMILHMPPFLAIVVYMVWKRAQDVFWILGGGVLLTLATFNDFLIYFWHWKGIYLTHYATLFFAFSQSLVTGRRFARTYQRNQDLLEEIKEKERARTLFFHNTSHELRTPLNGIIGFLRLLASDRFGRQTTEARQQLEKCIRLAESLTLQVNTILDLAKSRRGALRLHFNSFSLTELLRDAEYLAEGLLLRRGMASFQSLPGWNLETDLSFHGDREKIATILRNLLGNAFKFSDPARLNRVCLRIEKRQGELLIEVSDSGIGIAEEQIQDIFEEFRQLAGDARRGYEGTGLGLAMVKDLVQLMKGRIDVKSRLGEGSTFSIVIPEQGSESLVLQDVAQESWEFQEQEWSRGTRPRPLSIEAGQGLENHKILVVDDHELNCEVMQNILEYQGYQVIVAYGGREAMDLARRERPDLILLDVMMPGYSGEDVLRDLRENRELQDIPVVLITARASDSDRVLGLSLGADDYLAKPIQSEELLFRVRNLLRRLNLRGKVVRDEEQDRWIQMGRLLLELSHELKNVFHYVDHSGLKKTSLVRLYAGLPLAGEAWLRAVDVWIAGERERSDIMLDHLSLTEADPVLIPLQGRIAALPLSFEDQKEIWASLCSLSKPQRQFCLELLSFLRQHRILSEQVDMARDLLGGILELGRDDNQLRAEFMQAWTRLERLFRGRWLQLGIKVQVDARKAIVPMSQSAFLQVCLNLLGNATDAVSSLAHDQRWIKISLEETEQDLSFCIQNGGQALSPEQVQSLFDEGAKPEGQRKSFGLAITRRILQKAAAELSYQAGADNPEFVVKFQKRGEERS